MQGGSQAASLHGCNVGGREGETGSRDEPPELGQEGTQPSHCGWHSGAPSGERQRALGQPGLQAGWGPGDCRWLP